MDLNMKALPNISTVIISKIFWQTLTPRGFRSRRIMQVQCTRNTHHLENRL